MVKCKMKNTIFIDQEDFTSVSGIQDLNFDEIFEIGGGTDWAGVGNGLINVGTGLIVAGTGAAISAGSGGAGAFLGGGALVLAGATVAVAGAGQIYNAVAS